MWPIVAQIIDWLAAVPVATAEVHCSAAVAELQRSVGAPTRRYAAVDNSICISTYSHLFRKHHRHLNPTMQAGRQTLLYISPAPPVVSSHWHPAAYASQLSQSGKL